MSTVSYNCPCCGGLLSYTGTSGKLECTACGNSYAAEDMEALDLQQEGSQVQFAVDAENFNDADAVRSCICENCGAELVCEETTTATECPYCGSPAILSDRILSGVKPEKVIPFLIGSEQAAESFNNYFKGRRLLPNVFLKSDNSIGEMRKLYAPYWLFDCSAYADIIYRAEKKHTERRGEWEITRTEHYAVRRRGTVDFDSIPVDGSEKLDDRIAESLEPYDLSKAVPFRTSVLAGAMSDRADVNADECHKRAQERVEASTEELMLGTVKGYSAVHVGKKYIRSENGKATPVLMPVWLITTDKQEKTGKKTYTFAVNGQTGRFTCDIPYSKAKAWAWFGGIFAGIAAAACGVLAIMKRLQSDLILLAVLAALLIAFLTVSIMKGKFKTAHRLSGAGNYVRRDSLKLEIKQDHFLYITTDKRKIQTNNNNNAPKRGAGR